MTDAPRYGERPLPQTIAAAGSLRRLAGLLIAVESEYPSVAAMLASVAEWEAELASLCPSNTAPRINDEASGDGRVYLDHAFDVGAYNPCFPEYRFDHIDADAAAGTVTFPLVFEGPPGLVHGGFLGVFFDCVTQHHNCATGLSGKTRSLTVKYRRPTPLLAELSFDVERVEGPRGLASTTRLRLHDEVLCIGIVETLALPPEQLAGNRFGARRVSGT